MKNSFGTDTTSYIRTLLLVILITVVSFTIFQLIPMFIISIFMDNGVELLSEITIYQTNPSLLDEHFTSKPDIHSSVIKILKLLTFFSQIGTFLVPSIFIFWKFNQIKLLQNKTIKNDYLFVFINFILLLGISNLLVLLSLSIGYDYFPEGIKSYLSNEQLFNTKIQEYFVTKDVSNLAINLFLMAILPAIAEELFFRGVLQKIFIGIIKNKFIGILFTSLIFGILHFQIENFLAIFFASLLLGVIYEKRNNIKLNMLLHFMFNTFSLISIFIIKNEIINEEKLEYLLNYALIPAGILCFLYSLKKGNWKFS